MNSGTMRPIANDAIRWYGTGNASRLKMVLPSVKIHNGIITNALSVLIVVIEIDRSKFPPRITDHVLLAPPDGETPVKNRPSCISTLSGNRIIPKQ